MAGILDKLHAPAGTQTVVDNPDVTAWILSGWQFVRQVDEGHVLLRKVTR